MRPEDYWFETGTPSYLVELLKHTHYDLYELANTETDADVLNSIDSTSSNPVPVIYQSGYLTIKDYDSRFGIYKLGFPNLEVEEGFVKYLLSTPVLAPQRLLSKSGVLSGRWNKKAYVFAHTLYIIRNKPLHLRKT